MRLCAALLAVCAGCGSSSGSDAGTGGTGTEPPSDDAGAVDTGKGSGEDATGGTDGAGTSQDATAQDSTTGSNDSGAGAKPDATAPDAGTGKDASASADASDAARVDAARPADAGGTDATATGDGGVDPCGPNNPATVPLPVFGTGAFNVTTFGAVGDGTTDNTTAIQAALTAATAAGGGVVTVPAGTFLSGPLTVGSGTDLDLAAGATLEMLPMASWPGTTPFLNANGTHDIGLTGSGTIEGQGQAWWNALTATPTLVRPQEVVFNGSARVLIQGVHLQNPPEEHIWVKQDTNVTVKGITINTVAVAGQHIPSNTDGVDIGATGVFFCGNSVTCGDDNVVMNGANIYVAYSNFGVGHGCSIGSITQNGVNGVTVDNIKFNGTTSGIRMKSARGRGGLVQNLTYSNITMTGVGNPVFITSYYPTLPTDPTTDPAQAVTATTPQWTNITIKNLTATGSPVAGILWGLPEEPISNITFDNVSIQATTGMEIFHVAGASFIDGSKITVTTAPAATSFDATVTGLTTTPF
ncbi:MAG TPA: glycosyl hydrolase family 28 protein [Polyangiaceae bacterium]